MTISGYHCATHHLQKRRSPRPGRQTIFRPIVHSGVPRIELHPPPPRPEIPAAFLIYLKRSRHFAPAPERAKCNLIPRFHFRARNRGDLSLISPRKDSVVPLYGKTRNATPARLSVSLYYCAAVKCLLCGGLC